MLFYFRECGDPMSTFVKKLKRYMLSFEAREMACHFVDKYISKRKGESREIKNTFVRHEFNDSGCFVIKLCFNELQCFRTRSQFKDSGLSCCSTKIDHRNHTNMDPLNFY